MQGAKWRLLSWELAPRLHTPGYFFDWILWYLIPMTITKFRHLLTRFWGRYHPQILIFFQGLRVKTPSRLHTCELLLFLRDILSKANFWQICFVFDAVRHIAIETQINFTHFDNGCLIINYIYADSMHLVSTLFISKVKALNTYKNLGKKYFIFFLVGDLQVVTQSITPGVSLNKAASTKESRKEY